MTDVGVWSNSIIRFGAILELQSRDPIDTISSADTWSPPGLQNYPSVPVGLTIASNISTDRTNSPQGKTASLGGG